MQGEPFDSALARLQELMVDELGAAGMPSSSTSERARAAASKSINEAVEEAAALARTGPLGPVGDRDALVPRPAVAERARDLLKQGEADAAQGSPRGCTARGGLIASRRRLRAGEADPDRSSSCSAAWRPSDRPR